tara:strand:+ start:136 stop:1470 length:1335 start_codon:yes stop_codon:yes gene_type:complete
MSFFLLGILNSQASGGEVYAPNPTWMSLYDGATNSYVDAFQVFAMAADANGDVWRMGYQESVSSSDLIITKSDANGVFIDGRKYQLTNSISFSDLMDITFDGNGVPIIWCYYDVNNGSQFAMRLQSLTDLTDNYMGRYERNVAGYISPHDFKYLPGPNYIVSVGSKQFEPCIWWFTPNTGLFQFSRYLVGNNYEAFNAVGMFADYESNAVGYDYRTSDNRYRGLVSNWNNNGLMNNHQIVEKGTLDVDARVSFGMGTNTYVAFRTSTPSVLVRKYQQFGSTAGLWTKEITDSAETLNGYTMGMTADTSDNTYTVVGIGSTKLLIVKLDTSGNTVWIRKVTVPNIRGSLRGSSVKWSNNRLYITFGYALVMKDDGTQDGTYPLIALTTDDVIIETSATTTVTNATGVTTTNGTMYQQGGDIQQSGNGKSDVAISDPGQAIVYLKP